MTGPRSVPLRPVRRHLRRAALVLPHALLGLLAVAGAVWADSVAVIGSHPLHTADTATHIELHAPTVPDADATLTFHNRGTNGARDNRDYSVTWRGLTVTARYTWDADGAADRIAVAPPPGYRAVPDVLTLREETRGEIHLYRWEGM